MPLQPTTETTLPTKQICCGAAHTACVTASGQLFVWGCGDGGRLGLGEERLGPQYEPVLVESLSAAGERIGSVSCGNSHTLVSTAGRLLATWLLRMRGGRETEGDRLPLLPCKTQTRLIHSPRRRKQLSCRAALPSLDIPRKRPTPREPTPRLSFSSHPHWNRVAKRPSTQLQRIMYIAEEKSLELHYLCNTYRLPSAQALTAVREAHEDGEGGDEGRAKLLGGGRMFQAGSTNVLGTFCPTFTPVVGLDSVTVKQVCMCACAFMCLTVVPEGVWTSMTLSRLR